MDISYRINRYSPDSYLTVTLTFARNEPVSFSEVASEVEQAVFEANNDYPWSRQVLPTGYFGEDDE